MTLSVRCFSPTAFRLGFFRRSEESTHTVCLQVGTAFAGICWQQLLVLSLFNNKFSVFSFHFSKIFHVLIFLIFVFVRSFFHFTFVSCLDFLIFCFCVCCFFSFFVLIFPDPPTRPNHPTTRTTELLEPPTQLNTRPNTQHINTRPTTPLQGGAGRPPEGRGGRTTTEGEREINSRP